MDKLEKKETKLKLIDKNIRRVKEDIKVLKNQDNNDYVLRTIEQKKKQLSKLKKEKSDTQDQSREIKHQKSILVRFKKQYEKELKENTTEFKTKHTQAARLSQKISLTSKA